MKTKFFALMLMLASVVAVQAQSLTGKVWAADMSTKETPNTHFLMGFEENGTSYMSILSGQEVDKGVTLNITLIVPGSYTHNGNKLTMKTEKSKAELDFDLDIPGAPEANKKMIKNMLMGEIEKQKPEMIKEMVSELPKLDNATIKSLTATELVLVDSAGAELKFAAVDGK